ncbi:hypothetical protein PAPYR_11700 [Paratrimastix pyriformis]|uniref:Fungal-type protein kinase domain-containing protein n=1 Tax=Paratrimastix pyriformis TaxID=342808 RepID=A0ABQ8U371_9EUKA|nr:hypothetical protein PAPYR_11700 [Paratrimastix pyriformis]
MLFRHILLHMNSWLRQDFFDRLVCTDGVPGLCLFNRDDSQNSASIRSPHIFRRASILKTKKVFCARLSGAERAINAAFTSLHTVCCDIYSDIPSLLLRFPSSQTDSFTTNLIAHAEDRLRSSFPISRTRSARLAPLTRSDDPAGPADVVASASSDPRKSVALLRDFCSGLGSASAYCDPSRRGALIERYKNGTLHMTTLGPVPFPPQLVEKAFMQFYQECYNSDPPNYLFAPPLHSLIGLLTQAARELWDEMALRRALHQPLSELLRVPLAVQEGERWRCDLAYMVRGRLPAMILAFKREATGGSIYQLMKYYTDIWNDASPVGPCSTFLVQIGGPSITVSAAVFTVGRVFIEELASANALPFCSGPKDLRHLGKLFTALRRALRTLTRSLGALEDQESHTGGGGNEPFPFFFLDQRPVSPAPSHDQPSAPSHDQPPAPSHDQPPAPSHDQPSAPSHDQPSAPSHDQPSAPSASTTHRTPASTAEPRPEPLPLRVCPPIERIGHALCFRARLPPVCGPRLPHPACFLTTDLLQGPDGFAAPIILKIAKERYGLRAHLFAMHRGFAPPLIACYELPSMRPLFLAPGATTTTTTGPATATAAAMLPDDPTGDYILVVMADVSFTSWSDMAVAERKAHVARLGTVVEELHAQGLAHGDLRGCNVGLARAPPTADPWLCVLDYDWAGPAGAVRYPPNINHEIRWPKGALGEAPIQVEHDLHWLDLLRQACDRAGLHVGSPPRTEVPMPKPPKQQAMPKLAKPPKPPKKEENPKPRGPGVQTRGSDVSSRVTIFCPALTTLTIGLGRRVAFVVAQGAPHFFELARCDEAVGPSLVAFLSASGGAAAHLRRVVLQQFEPGPHWPQIMAALSGLPLLASLVLANTESPATTDVPFALSSPSLRHLYIGYLQVSALELNCPLLEELWASFEHIRRFALTGPAPRQGTMSHWARQRDLGRADGATVPRGHS